MSTELKRREQWFQELISTVDGDVLLIIHGTADAAVVPFNADMSFVALRQLRKDVAYGRYADQS